MVAGERADGDRREGWPEHCRPDLRDRLAGQLGHDTQAAEVRGLALVRRHPEGRVALQMLDRTEAFAMREFDVARRNIVLKIDEGLALPDCRPPEGRMGDAFRISRVRLGRGRLKAARVRGIRPGTRAGIEPLGETKLPGRGTDSDEAAG